MLELTNVAAFTHPKANGKNNEDSILLPLKINNGYIFGIADGVGSYLGAELASRLALNYLKKLETIPSETEIKNLLLEIKKLIGDLELKNKDYYQAATTLTFGIMEEKGLHIVHVGDSRLYVKIGQKLICKTKDHTQHQKLLEEGLFTERQLKKMPGKNILSTALSKNINLEYQHTYIDAKDITESSGDLVINIMSDGAYEFWEKRPKFSINTMGNPTAFSTSLQRRIERHGPIDDYSLISLKFKISQIE